MREQITQKKSSADDVFRAQDAEMRQFQQDLTEVEAQDRRAETTTADFEKTTADLVRETETLLQTRLDERTEIVLDTATKHFDDFSTASRQQLKVLTGKSKDTPTRSGG